MLNRKSYIAVVFLLANLLLPFGIEEAHAFVIRTGAQEWCPYVCFGETNGFVPELLVSILDEAGFILKVKNVTTKDALREILNRRMDCVITSNLHGYSKPDEPQAEGYFALFTTGDKIAKINPDRDLSTQLAGLNIGVMKDKAYPEIIREYLNSAIPAGKAVSLERSSYIEKASALVREGKLDGFIEAEDAVTWKMKSSPAVKGLKNAGRVSSEPFRIYFQCAPSNPQSKYWISLVSKGMTKLRLKGEMNGLLKKYGLKDWVGP